MSTSKAAGSAVALSKSIAGNTALIGTYRKENGLPPLDSETDAIDAVYPPQIEKVRRNIIRDAQQLQELVSGRQAIFVNEFRIPDMVPLDSTVSYETLSEKTSIRVGVLRQILRAAITFGMFKESKPGHIAHSAITKRWAGSEGIHSWIKMLEAVTIGATNLSAALQNNPAMDSPATAPYMLALGTGDSGYYEYLNRNSEKAKLFSEVMSNFQAGDGYDPKHVVKNFDWSALKGGHLVDLGGSMGEIAFALKKNFDLQITVQALPSNIQAAREQPDLKGVNFMELDFFDPQPVHGADVYMFRWILHNWPDAFAVRILRALIPGLKPGARVLIVDEIMPAIGTTSPQVEKNQRILDITMLDTFNAKVRELEDRKQLFAAADPRFAVVGVKDPQDSRLGFIEVQRQG